MNKAFKIIVGAIGALILGAGGYQPNQLVAPPVHDPLAGTLFRTDLSNTTDRGFYVIDGNIYDRYAVIFNNGIITVELYEIPNERPNITRLN